MSPRAVRVHPEYRAEGGRWLIELRLRDVRQVFNRLDPAPFREKDLDPAAEAYIEDAVSEIGVSRPMKIVVRLADDAARDPEASALPDAIAHYFEYRAAHVGLELRRLLKQGAASLVIALVFLGACLALRQTLQSLSGWALLSEGLLIIGWVGLWRPVEIFLYDWWPLWRRKHRLENIAALPVEVLRDG